MRTVIDLPEEQMKGLTALAKSLGVSRAELIRRAVAEFFAKTAGKTEASAFGLWKSKPRDSISYQSRLRDEWGEDQ